MTPGMMAAMRLAFALLLLPSVALTACSGGSSAPQTQTTQGAVVLPGEYTAWVLPASSPTASERRAVQNCAAAMPSHTETEVIEGALAFGFSGVKSAAKTEQLANQADDCLDHAVPGARTFGVTHVCHKKAPRDRPSPQPGVPDAFQPRC